MTHNTLTTSTTEGTLVVDGDLVLDLSGARTLDLTGSNLEVSGDLVLNSDGTLTFNDSFGAGDS